MQDTVCIYICYKRHTIYLSIKIHPYRLTNTNSNKIKYIYVQRYISESNCV